MSDISEWEASTRRNQSFQNDTEQNVIAIIASLLKESVSPNDAARDVSRIYEPLVVGPSAPRHRGWSNRISNLWGILSLAIRELGGSYRQSENLVEFIDALRNGPVVRNTDGSPVQHDDSSGIYWSDLPGWALCLGQSVLYMEHYLEDEDNKQDFYAQAPQLLNAATFAATLLARTSFDSGELYYASAAMQEGLEIGYAPQSLSEEWRVFLPPAATWILIAGPKLRELCLNGHRSIAAKPEKWVLWKQRFSVFAESIEVDENCRSLSARAARHMEELDGS